MIINRSNLDLIFRNLKASFTKAFDAAEANWPMVAMLVMSSSTENLYAWQSHFPRMREWLGEKTLYPVEGRHRTVRNRDWEATIEISRNDIQDDQLGVFSNQAEMAGYSAAMLPDELVFALMSDGFTEPCYDGKSFYATDHPAGSQGTISNKMTEALSANSLAAAKGSFGKARTMLRKMKSNDGQSLDVKPSVLVVPPALEDVADVLLMADSLGGDDPNPYKQSDTNPMIVKVCENRLKTDTEWHLIDGTKPVKPFVWQERERAHVTALDRDYTETAFMRKLYRYSAEARGAAAFGLWRLAVGSDGTT